MIRRFGEWQHKRNPRTSLSPPYITSSKRAAFSNGRNCSFDDLYNARRMKRLRVDPNEVEILKCLVEARPLPDTWRSELRAYVAGIQRSRV